MAGLHNVRIDTIVATQMRSLSNFCEATKRMPISALEHHMGFCRTAHRACSSSQDRRDARKRRTTMCTEAQRDPEEATGAEDSWQERAEVRLAVRKVAG